MDTFYLPGHAGVRNIVELLGEANGTLAAHQVSRYSTRSAQILERRLLDAVMLILPTFGVAQVPGAYNDPGEQLQSCLNYPRSPCPLLVVVWSAEHAGGWGWSCRHASCGEQRAEHGGVQDSVRDG